MFISIRLIFSNHCNTVVLSINCVTENLFPTLTFSVGCLGEVAREARTAFSWVREECLRGKHGVETQCGQPSSCGHRRRDAGGSRGRGHAGRPACFLPRASDPAWLGLRALRLRRGLGRAGRERCPAAPAATPAGGGGGGCSHVPSRHPGPLGLTLFLPGSVSP